jgi:ssDNA-binding Zn-finger/Zn-ribbon topoisomerase 1
MSDDVTIWPCPKCSNGFLTHRTNSKTKSKFLGCSNYPKCKYTQPEESVNENNIPDAASVWE